MASIKTQDRGSIVDAKDLRYFVRIASKNWYFVVVALVLSAVLSYLYSYKLPDIYGASTQILLKDQDSYDYQNQMFRGLGYVQSYSDIVNQKRGADIVCTAHRTWISSISTSPTISLVVSRHPRSTAHCLSWSIWTCWTIA